MWKVVKGVYIARYKFRSVLEIKYEKNIVLISGGFQKYWGEEYDCEITGEIEINSESNWNWYLYISSYHQHVCARGSTLCDTFTIEQLEVLYIFYHKNALNVSTYNIIEIYLNLLLSYTPTLSFEINFKIPSPIFTSAPNFV